jgi:ribosomal protein S18 acetylase RimI-like enzyme
MRVVVVRTYVEMRSSEEARLAYPDIPGLEVRRISPPDVPAYRETFQDIGREVLWIDRWDWQEEEFAELLSRTQVKAWLAWLDGVPAGLIEGHLEDDGAIQFTFVGVRPQFQGRGIGKFLLSSSIERSWEMKVTRVWLYTITSDGEHALKNYLKRGFRIWKRRAAILTIPDGLAPKIQERMESARSRGIEPGFLRHVEAYLRESRAGKLSKRIVWRLKLAIRAFGKSLRT